MGDGRKVMFCQRLDFSRLPSSSHLVQPTPRSLLVCYSLQRTTRQVYDAATVFVADEKLITSSRDRMSFLLDKMGVSRLGRKVHLDSKQVCKETVTKHHTVLYN
jgi:hypothetical protein